MEWFSSATKFTLLSNALSDVEEFRFVQNAMDIHDKPDDFHTYVTMVEKAATTYDKAHSKTKGKHKINMMDQYSSTQGYSNEEYSNVLNV